MSEADGLFGNLVDQAKTDPGESGLPAVRLRVAQRDQPEFQVVDLDSLLAVDHPARAVWAFVTALDLSEVLASIKARRLRHGAIAASLHRAGARRQATMRS